MRFLSFILWIGLGLSWLDARAEDVPRLQSSPQNPLFVDFLFPSRALELFSSPSGSSAARLVQWHFENEVLPFFEVLKEQDLVLEILETNLKSWEPNFLKDFSQRTNENEWADFLSSLATLENLSNRQKAVLTSIFNLVLLSDLEEEGTEDSLKTIQDFFKGLEKSPLQLKEFFQINPQYFFERVSELEALGLYRPEMTELEIARTIFELRQNEALRTSWGSEEQKISILNKIRSQSSWGLIDSEYLSKISDHSWQNLESQFLQHLNEAWVSDLWNPFRQDASITRVPALISAGLALRYMTRWVRVATGITQSSDLFFQQLSASSGLSRAQLESWVKDPSKSHYPKDLKQKHRHLLKRPDFRTAFDGARRLELEKRSILNFAEMKFGVEAQKKIQQFIELEVESKGFSDRMKMNAICAASLISIEAGGLRVYASRRKIQAELARVPAFGHFGPRLKKRIREFLEEDFGVKNHFWSYTPWQFQKSWWPIRRHKFAQLASKLQALENLRPKSRFSWIANPRIPSGSFFKGAWPLEYVSRSYWGHTFSKLGRTSLWAAGFFSVIDSLFYWRYLHGPRPDVDSPEMGNHPIFKNLMEQRASNYEIQALSLANLLEDLRTLEVQTSKIRVEEGFGPVTFFLDPRSAFLPEKETSRVSSVFVFLAPHHRLRALSPSDFEKAFILRFDSVWEPEGEFEAKNLHRAYWRLSQVLDVEKFSKALKSEFLYNLEIEKSILVWSDPVFLSTLSWKAPESVVYSGSVDSRAGRPIP